MYFHPEFMDDGFLFTCISYLAFSGNTERPSIRAISECQLLINIHFICTYEHYETSYSQN